MTFADGIRFALAMLGESRLGPGYDPVLNRKLSEAIRKAEQGMTPPRFIDVEWITTKQPWRNEWNKIAKNVLKDLALTIEPDEPARGRISNGDLAWDWWSGSATRK
jgi:hypothetical protein